MTTKRLLLALTTVVLAGMLTWPATAQAQRRGGRGFGTVVVLGGGFGFPGYYYDQYPLGPWGPWGPYGRVLYPYSYNEFMWASVRLEIQPKQAEVYVDGSQAGIVDDFDSWYQSLNLPAGEHDIAIYLEGYRTKHYQLYLSPGSSQHFKGTLEKLAAGEKPEPRPRPTPPPARPLPTGGQQPEPGRGQAPPNQPPAPNAPARFGTLSLRIQPADAEVLVDNQPWTGAAADMRLSIRLSAGRHHVEVRKAGYDTYTEDILIREDATMTLNVGLTKR